MRKLAFVGLAVGLAGCGGREPPPVTCTAGGAGSVPLFLDVDGDGYGAGPAELVCIVDGRPPEGYAQLGDDCAPQDPERFALHAGFVDEDGDGHGTTADERCEAEATSLAPVDGDCAPQEPLRWRLLEHAAVDADGDGIGVVSEGEVCSGAALPEGYLARPPLEPDCDDADPVVWSLQRLHVDEDGDGKGYGEPVEVCTAADGLPEGYAWTGGDCEPQDPERFQELVYDYRDHDLDEAFVREPGRLCGGAALPLGYAVTSTVIDCDDTDPTLYATFAYAARDADLDGYTVTSTGSLCIGREAPAGFLTTTSTITDCDDGDPEVFRNFDYTDRDADLDGHTVTSTGTLCLGTSTPRGFLTQSSTVTDCDDADPGLYLELRTAPDLDGDGHGDGPLVPQCTDGTVPRWRALVTGDCAPNDGGLFLALPYVAVDRDGDGHTAPEAGLQCTAGALTAPYFGSATGLDCDDGDPSRWVWTLLFTDADGDGLGVPPGRKACLDGTRPAGTSRYGDDADDTDPGSGPDEDITDLILLEL